MGLSRVDLANIAIRTGYPVKTAWTNGHGTMGTILGCVMHHTATPDTYPGDYPSLRVVTEGRSDLPGPLCNFGLGRSGTIYLVTEGIAWHAGVGAYGGTTDGNGHFLGIEAESGGTGFWTPEQLDSYPRLVASILWYIGKGPEWAIRHAKWALPVGRKNDTYGIDMTWFGNKVYGYLSNTNGINRNNIPAPPTDEDEDMKLTDVINAGSASAITGAQIEWRNYNALQGMAVDSKRAADATVAQTAVLERIATALEAAAAPPPPAT